MDCERAPAVPAYWGALARTSCRTADDVPAVRNTLTTAFAAHDVVFAASAQHRCGYSCSAFPGTLIEFEVGIFEESREPTRHVVEFRHMFGCRYAASHFITHLGESIGMIFPGRPLPMGPPPLPNPIEPSEEAVRQSCDFLRSLIAGDSSRSMVEQGLRSVAATRPHLFLGPAAGLIAPTVDVLKRFEDDDEMRMAATFALAAMAKVCPADMRIAAALARGRLDPNPHVRRLAL